MNRSDGGGGKSSDALNGLQLSLGATLEDRDGVLAPTRYADVGVEARRSAETVGLFDLSPAGKVFVQGPQRLRFLDDVLTCRVADLEPGLGRVGLLLDETGAIETPVRICVRAQSVVLLCPARTRAALLRSLRKPAEGRFVGIEDASLSVAMLSVQGPFTDQALKAGLETAPPGSEPLSTVTLPGSEGGVLLVRSPQTGSDGVHLLVPRAAAAELFERLLTGVQSVDGVPAGLAAFDVGRIHAGVPAVGAEILPGDTPADVGLLEQAVDLGKPAFRGRAAVLARRAPPRALSGIGFAGDRLPRPGDQLAAESRAVGRVTSACLSPILDRVIALALVEPEFAPVGTKVRTATGLVGVVEGLPFGG